MYVKLRLYISMPSPSLCPSPSKFTLYGQNGMEPILAVKQSITIGATINFDGDGYGDSNDVGRCKQSLTSINQVIRQKNPFKTALKSNVSVIVLIQFFSAIRFKDRTWRRPVHRGPSTDRARPWPSTIKASWLYMTS